MGESKESGQFEARKPSEEAQGNFSNVELNTLSGPASGASAHYWTNTQIHKYGTRGGTGYAAEDANDLADRIAGKSTFQVGGNNAANGPDRIVDGNIIQTKYFDSAAATVRDAFGEDGKYRYGKMQLEVPTDQYDDAVRIMRKRIEENAVPGVTDPKKAESLVREGNVTYAQARNIARAGTVESLKFDAQNSVVVGGYVFAISFLISFAKSTWDGKSSREALRLAMGAGLQGAGTAFITSVISAQLMRTDLARASTVFIEKGLDQVASTKLGKSLIEKYAESTAGRAMDFPPAKNIVARQLRNQVITGLVTTTVLTVPDVYRATLKKNTSWGQVGKNLLVTGSSVAAGSVGWMGGSVAGAAIGSVVPFAGTAIGSVVGGLAGAAAASWGGSKAKTVLDQYIEDDADEMVRIVQDVLVEIASEYILNEAEFIQYNEAVLRGLNVEVLRDMYASKDRRQFVYANFKAACEAIAASRPIVGDPTESELQEAVLEALNEVSPEEAQELPPLSAHDVEMASRAAESPHESPLRSAGDHRVDELPIGTAKMFEKPSSDEKRPVERAEEATDSSVGHPGDNAKKEVGLVGSAMNLASTTYMKIFRVNHSIDKKDASA